VRVWRLAKRTRPAFDGDGARLYGGRWNRPGVAVIYTAESLSLAILEFFVHLNPNDTPDLVTIAADAPERVKIERVDSRSLPSNWRATPAPPALADIGTAWAQKMSTAILAVPSAIVPNETNYLLNPRHDDFAQIRVAAPERFSFDPRLLGR
jgi:RES domain-containing protein